jgi:gliding motility-associated-like protein
VLQPLVYIPNAFAPSGQSANKEFKVIFGNIDYAAITNYSMMIADRFGNEVFNSTNPQDGWSGKDASGTIKELGTYFYTIQYTFNKRKVKKRGDVLLLK